MKLIFSLLLVSLSFNALSQSGWDLIAQNKLAQARISFEETLESDSTNFDALCGLIFIAEVTQDHLIQERTTNKLLQHHYSDKLFYCLSPYTDYTAMSEQDKAFQFKRHDLSSEARSLKEERKFDAYEQKYLEIYNPLKWSYIGPFQNINGYGFIKPIEVESDTYDTNKKYNNILKEEFSWVEPKYHHPSHAINFKRHLNVGNNNVVCFANTFFTLEKDQVVQLKIGRSSPMKIWMDDQLIFEGENMINFMFESEYVKLTLKKGTHRILVKSIIGDYFTGAMTPRGYGNTYDLMRSFKSGIRIMQDMEIFYREEYYNDIRLANEDGTPIALTSSFTTTDYEKGDYQPEMVIDNFMEEIKTDIANNPENLFDLYLLQLAALSYGNLSEMEEFFYLKWKENPQSTFHKYLAAKTFMINGKREKGYEALDGIALEENPIYVTLSDKLKEIDPVNNSSRFAEKLNNLLTIAPTNLNLIQLKADFLKEEGKTDSLVAFVENIMESYSEYSYSYRLEKYLDEDYKPYDYDLNDEFGFDVDDTKAFKTAKKRIHKEFNIYDYNRLIKQYKSDKKEAKVLELYDELIEIEPYAPKHRTSKSKYLFNLERYDEALSALQEVLTINPRDNETFELMGDIYFDQKKEDEALKYYLIAEECAKGIGNGSYGYYGNTLQKKIDKIRGKAKLKGKFEEVSFEDWVNNDAWHEQAYDEESLILGYSTDLFYDKKGKVTLYSKMMIIILTEAGAASWVQYDFSRLGNIDVVKVIKHNGAEQIPDVSGGFVVFKGLEPGDVIQIEASSEWTPISDLGNELVFFNYATFHAPIVNYKLEAAFPEGRPIHVLTHKVKDTKVKTTKDGYDHYKWEYKNLPKVANEEAVLDQNDTYTNIQISTVNGWGEVVNWYKAKSYKKLDSKYEIREILDTLVNDGMTEMEKTIAVYNYITKEINYSSNSLLNSNYIPKNADLTCSSRIGDCKDVATVMLNMLKELDIKAYYVLVKTNGYFDMEIVPSTYFNHVIAGVEIDGEMHYFDLTTDNYPYNVTNQGDSYAWALLIKDENEKLFRLPNDYINVKKNLMEFETKAVLNDDYSVEMEVDVTYRGITAGYMRESIKSLPKSEVENMILGMIGEELFSNVKLKDYSFNNVDSISDPLKGHYSLHSDNYSDHILDIDFMNIPFLNAIWNSVVFSSDERQNTIDLSLITDVVPTKETVYFSFPKGKRIYKLPQDVNVENEYFIYSLNFSKSGQQLKVEKTQTFLKQRVSAEEFESFKKLYLELYNLNKTKIVLIDKGNSLAR